MEKIKKFLLMENKAFNIIHITSVVVILILGICIGIERYLIYIWDAENNDVLNNIEIQENEEMIQQLVKLMMQRKFY